MLRLDLFTLLPRVQPVLSRTLLYCFVLLLLVPFSIQGVVGQALTVVSVTPEMNGMSVPVDGPIVVDFSREIDPSSIDDSKFRVFGRWSGPMTGTIGFPVSNPTRFEFIPDTPFFYGEQVTVSLAKSITDDVGVGLESGFQWTFWTAVTGGSLDFVFEGQVDIRQDGEGSILAYGAYAGDFDNDGWSDLLVPNETPDDFRVFLNDGAGAYSDFAIVDMPQSSNPSTNEGGDFNNDGEIDIAIGSGSGRNVSVFMGTGSGSFQPEVAYEAGEQGSWIRGLCVADLDGDGWDDLIATNRDGDKLSLLLNDGDGTFGAPTPIEAQGSVETTCATADVNLDGILDVFVGSFVSKTMSLMLGDGAGGLVFSDSIAIEGSPWMSVAGDLNGDSVPDVVTSGFTGRNISVVFASSDGSLTSATSYDAGDAVIAVDLGDLDADGDLDVVSSNLSSGDWTIFENDGTGSLTIFGKVPASTAGSCAILHDRDNDGDLDLTGIDETDDVIFLYTNPNNVGVESLILDATFSELSTSLHWTTASELDNEGFDVQRQSVPKENIRVDQWLTLGFVEGAGSTRTPQYYSFIDDGPIEPIASYRLRQVDRDGSFTYSNVVEISNDAFVQALSISDPYPNPFSGFTTLGVRSPVDADLTVRLFNLAGQEVQSRINIFVQRNKRTDVTIDAESLAPGVYFVRLSSATTTSTIPVVISN